MKNIKLSLLLISSAFVMASCGGNNPQTTTADASNSSGTSAESSLSDGTSNPNEDSTKAEETSDQGQSASSGDATEPEESSEEGDTPLYFVAGSFNDWATNNEDYALFPTETTVEEKAVFATNTLSLKANAAFKIVDGEGAWHPEGMGNDIVIPETADYVIYFVPEGGVTLEGYIDGSIFFEKVGEYSGELSETSYYIVGTFNQWKAKDPDYLMTKEEEQIYGKDIYTIDMALEDGDELKFVDSDGVWYPDGGNLVFSEGYFKIDFCPAGGMPVEEGWFGGVGGGICRVTAIEE